MTTSSVVLMCILAFGGVVAWSAWHGYRTTATSEDYFVAARGAPWYLITGSLMASTISGATFFGLISSYYRSGFAIHWIPLGVAFSWIVLCFAVGPRLRRYGRFTIPEYLAERFQSPALRSAFALITVVWMVFLLGSVLVQGGLLFGSLWGWSYGLSVLVITLVVLTYTFFGGQKAVFWTDFVQGAAFLVAVAIVVPITISAAGGWGHITETISADRSGYFSATGDGGILSAVSLFFVWFLGYLGHSGYLTRFYAARSERDIYKAGIAVSLVYLPFWALIGMVGAAMRVVYPNAEDTEVLWIRFVLEHTPSLVAGLLLAAILAGILSSSDTWLLTAATSGTHDFYRRVTRRPLNDQRLLRLTKWTVVLLGLAAMPFGLWRPTYITEMMNIAYTIAGASGGVLIIFSLYWGRMTKQGAWAGLIFGAVAAVAGRLAVAVGITPGWFDPVLPTLVGTALVIIGVSLATRPEAAAVEVFERLQRRTAPSRESKPAPSRVQT